MELPLRTYAYIASEDGVSTFQLGGNGSMRPGAVVGTASVALASHPSEPVLYALTSGSISVPGTVTAFQITADTGALESLGTFALDRSAASIEVHPNGRLVYVTHNDAVSIFDVDAAGRLSSRRAHLIGASPDSLAFHPSGEFLYVLKPGADQLESYRVDSTSGALDFVNSVLTVANSANLAVHPTASGSPVYVSANEITIHEFDAGTGFLGDAIVVETSGRTRSIVLHPAGRFAYVAKPFGQQVISSFAMDPQTGILSSELTISISGRPHSLAVDPTGKVLLAALRPDNALSMFAIDQGTGGLTQLGTPVAGTGTNPADVMIVSFSD